MRDTVIYRLAEGSNLGKEFKNTFDVFMLDIFLSLWYLMMNYYVYQQVIWNVNFLFPDLIGTKLFCNFLLLDFICSRDDTSILHFMDLSETAGC